MTKGCVCNPKCCVLTEFLPKTGALSLTLMEQGWTHSPKVNPSGYPTKFWCLFGVVAPIAHNTENFLIGPFAISDTFHWSRHMF